MMRSSLKARVAREGSVRDASPAASGIAVALNLRPDRARLGPVQTIPAIAALVQRGVSVLRAKRALEAMAEAGDVFVVVPKVAETGALLRDLREAGILARPPIVAPGRKGRQVSVDVGALRGRLGMTQEQFATVYQIALPLLRNWEQGRNRPDRMAAVLLRMIEAHPKEVATLLWEQ